jgi:hypothetical protein
MHTASLTWEEQERFAYFGNDPKAAILGELADRSSAEDLFSGIESHVDEAHAAYPAEDFAHEVIADLRGFAKRLRGQNRTDLLAIMCALVELQSQQFLSTDHGREELSKIRMILGT